MGRIYVLVSQFEFILIWLCIICGDLTMNSVGSVLKILAIAKLPFYILFLLEAKQCVFLVVDILVMTWKLQDDAFHHFCLTVAKSLVELEILEKPRPISNLGVLNELLNEKEYVAQGRV